MPIYEYKCRQCGREFEELVFGEQSPPCPGCGDADAERLLSCACLHMPAPSRQGQTVTYPSSGMGGMGGMGGGGGCAGCTASSCAGCK